MTAYLVAFCLTCVVELPVYAALLAGRYRVRLRRVLVAALVANVVTHPFLWWGVRAHQHSAAGYAVAFVAGEALVCAVEGLVLWLAVRRQRPGVPVWPVAVLANMVSAGCGLLLALG